MKPVREVAWIVTDNETGDVVRKWAGKDGWSGVPLLFDEPTSTLTYLLRGSESRKVTSHQAEIRYVKPRGKRGN
jgi:hypothetical protein